MTVKQMEQFLINLKRQKLKYTFTKQRGDTFSLIKIGSHISGRAAARHDFSIVRNLAAVYCIFEVFKDTPERKGDIDRTEADGSYSYTFQLETILISPRMFIQFEVNLEGGTHC